MNPCFSEQEQCFKTTKCKPQTILHFYNFHKIFC